MLAAGVSRRWGADNKLLAMIGDKPMLRHTVESLLASTAQPILVVTGHQHQAVEAALAGLPVSFHHAADFAQGMSASLKIGVAALPDDCAGALICLGDMPWVRPATFDMIADAYDTDSAALVPTYRGMRGNPVLLGRPLFPDIVRLTGDRGARALFTADPGRVREIAVDDPGILRDADTPAALGGPTLR